MKVRRRKAHRYYTMQSGGLPVFRGLPRHRMRGSGFWGSLIGKAAKTIGRRVLPAIGKKLTKTIVPIAIDTGEKILTGKAKPKQAIKAGLKRGKKEIVGMSKAALQKELTKYIKGGSLLRVQRTKYNKKRF